MRQGRTIRQGCLALGGVLIATQLVATTVHAQTTTQAPRQTSGAPTDRFAIPDVDENLPGMGPLRRHTWFRKLWHDRRSQWAADAARDRGAVVLLGDSITQGWNDRLAAAFPGMKVANRGISGDTSRGVLLRLQEDVLAIAPKAVVLLIGTNDLEEGARPDVVEHNTRLIIDALRKHDAQMPIVLNLVFPSSETKKRAAEHIRDVNTRLIALSKTDPHTTVVDTYTLWAQPDGNAPVSEFPDLLHLNDAGYARWASALRPVLETLGVLPVPADTFVVEPGFESLFNGRDLTGWGYRPTSLDDRKAAARWQLSDRSAPPWPMVETAEAFDGRTESPDGRFRVVGGRLVVTAPREYRKIQQLWTTKEFGEDFVVKMEFRATPNADSGVYLRGPQFQVRDYRLAGPFTELTRYKPQDWNELVITVRGGVVEATCNGEALPNKLALPASGPIGVEGDRGQMEYRRIRIGKPTP